MNQTKYNDSIYVLVNEAYEIQTDETINNIYVPEDAYDDFVALNPTLNLTKINYRTFRVTKYPFVAFFRYENPEFFDLCKQQGWVERDDFMTLEECAAVTNAQMAQIAGTKASNYVSKAKDCKSLVQLQYFTGLTEIPEYCFGKCTLVTKVVLPPNTVTSIGDDAFDGCSGLSSVIIPNSVTSIGVGAFADCSSLRNVIIPNGVTSINTATFYNCGLTSITIPNTVTSIGDYAFEECSDLASVTIPNSVSSIGKYAFDVCRSLTSVTIGSGVTKIGEFAFYSCSNLTSVIIPNSVTSIGIYVFWGCSRLLNVILGNTLATIGDCAFQGCTSLKEITIPNSVTKLGIATFAECTNFESIKMERTTPPTAGKNLFTSVSPKLIIYVPNDSVDAYKAATNWATYASKIIGY
jgi:Flp pilus assembly protein protease CpaA